MLKIAIDSGHGLNTAGKEVPSYMGQGIIKEWTLNDKITREVIRMLKDYNGVELLRLDDPTGRVDVPLAERCNKANSWGADIVISNHHNAGISGGAGGGLVVYRYTNSSIVSKGMQRDLYNFILAKTKLKGNRFVPLSEARFKILQGVKAPALLIEHGFMDSRTDLPVILEDGFARLSAQGIMDFLEHEYKIYKKDRRVENTVYRVHVGAFFDRTNAEKLKKELEGKGYTPIIAIGKI